jgi:lysophospholipase L1-like esterase
LTTLAIIIQIYLNSNNTMRVACIGDSLTEESGYPNDLQTLLGSNYEVGNFGVSSTTVQLDTYKPYFYEPKFAEAKEFRPHVVVIMLGTNDARNDYAQTLGNFQSGYLQLINQIQALDTKPIIFIVLPPPIFLNNLALNDTIFEENIVPLIEQFANQQNLPIVNVYSALLNHQEYFPDGVHPNSAGAQIIANQVYEAITNYSRTQ